MAKIQETEDVVARLWLATKHGDEDHQQWLKDAYVAFFAGEPVPEPRGKGNEEKLIQSLSDRIDVLKGALERARGMICCSVPSVDSTMRKLYDEDDRQRVLDLIDAALHQEGIDG